MNHRPIGFDVIKDFNAFVITNTDEDVSTTNTFENLKPKGNEEIQLEFTIPPRLKNISVAVEVKVPQLYHKDDRTLKSHHQI
mmetsp:Transcript_24059/g.21081  ORF Transcript_24059/g.21081 Transcript_24059/m.21081 type:complete len:82 (+) Transcript_24059:622-867(+)